MKRPEIPRAQHTGILRRSWRVFRWVWLAASIFMLILVLRPSSPPRVDKDPLAEKRAQLKIHRHETATAAGRPHQLRLDEAELNALVEPRVVTATKARDPEFPASNPEPRGQDDVTVAEIQAAVEDVKLDLLDDRVRAYVGFNLYGKTLSLLLEGRLEVVDGYLRFQPVKGKFGSLPLPGPTLDAAVERLFESAENREKFLLPSNVRDVKIENSNLVVSYR